MEHTFKALLRCSSQTNKLERSQWDSKCFKEMLTRSLLIRAVRKNQSSTNAADSEIDSYAIHWFNLAPDRGGGRKERSRVKEALTEMAHGN